jgi:hypothetical protein
MVSRRHPAHSACGQSGGLPPRQTPGSPPLAHQSLDGRGSRADVAWLAIGILRHQLLPMVRVDAPVPAKISASTRSFYNELWVRWGVEPRPMLDCFRGSRWHMREVSVAASGVRFSASLV